MLSDQKIAITGCGVLAPQAATQPTEGALCGSAIVRSRIGQEEHWAAPLAPQEEQAINDLQQEKSVYGRLDRSALLAILASRRALQEANWTPNQLLETGINIGSARGATSQIESHHARFLNDPTHLSALASPVTTAGAIGSWVGADLGLSGPTFSHSMTCNSGLFALGNALAWLRSGMAQRFLAGGTEAPLTPFTLGQMHALKIYARSSNHPCTPLIRERERASGLVLGEGAAVFALEKKKTDSAQGVLAWVEGFGSCQEQPATATSVSENGVAFAEAMKNALRSCPTDEKIDAVFMHAPGTAMGDQSELAAVRTVFGEHLPALYSTKWKTGHLFGASGPVSLVHALTALKEQQMPTFPYPVSVETKTPDRIKRIMINSAGFGGNAVSLIISHPQF